MAIKREFKGINVKPPSGSGISSANCPKCKTPGYSVQYGKGYSRAFCFTCKWGYSNNLK